jgi:hypothetical protein
MKAKNRITLAINVYKEYEQGRRALMLLSAERATFRQPETE